MCGTVTLMFTAYGECPNHGFFEFDIRSIFTPEGLRVIEETSDGATVFETVMRNSKLPCPVCGQLSSAPAAKIQRTAFGTIIRPTTLAAAPHVDRLREALNEAKRQQDAQVPDAEVAARLEAEARSASPVIAKVLDSIGGKASIGLSAWLGVLIMIITAIVSAAGQLNESDVRQIVQDELKRSQQEPESTTPEEAPQGSAPAGEGSTPRTGH